MKETRNFKVGYSKEMPRVWIDGAVLVQYGFSTGTSYTVDLKPGRIELLAWSDSGTKVPAGARTVTGREGGKPIIDLRSQAMFTFIGDRCVELADGTLRVAVTFKPGRIVITLED